MPFSVRPYRRFPVQFLMTIATLLMLHTPSHAGLCLPHDVEKESPYRYVLTLIDSMGYAQTAIKRQEQKSSTNTEETLFQLFYGFKLAEADFDCAEFQVSPYVSSTNEAIRTSAKGAALSYSRLGALQEEAALHLKLLLDAGPNEFKYGTMLERQAERAASMDEVWKLLPPAAIAATYSVIEEDPTTGRMSGLALTAKQREEILQKLRSTFGEEITKGVKAGQISLVAAAAVLYEVIGNQPRKTRGSN